MTNLDSILKSRNIILPTKVHIVRAMVFPVVMYGCESWTIKKAECQRIDAFKLWCWRRLLRVPWTARRSNQSILKEINSEYSLEGLMAEASIIWPPDVKSRLIRKDPDVGKGWRQEEKEMTEDEMVGWHHRLNGHEFEQAPGVGEGQGSLVCCSPWGLKESDRTEQLHFHFLSLLLISMMALEKQWKWKCFSHVQLFCNLMDCSMLGSSVLHYLLEFAQIHIHWVGDAIELSHPLLSSSPFAFSLSQHQGLFQWIGSLHQVAPVLKLQLHDHIDRWWKARY